MRQIGVKCELYRLVSLCGKTLRSPLASPCNLKLSVLVEERGEDINSTLVAEASVSNLYLLHQVNDKVITKFPAENETFLSALCNFVWALLCRWVMNWLRQRESTGGTTVVVEVCVCAGDRKLRILSFAVKIKQFCRKFMMFLFMCSPFIMIVDIVLVHGTRVGTTLQLVTILRKTTCIKLTLGAHDSTDQIALWTEWAHVHGPGLDWNVVLWFRVRFKWVWDYPDFKMRFSST